MGWSFSDGKNIVKIGNGSVTHISCVGTNAKIITICVWKSLMMLTYWLGRLLC